MKESKLATILALAALDDSEIKSLEQRVNELAELGFKPKIVEELPESGNDHTLYLVPQNKPGENPWYKEYLWLNNEWENIGTTSINFENYELKSNKITTLDAQSTDEQYPSAKVVFDMIKDNAYKTGIYQSQELPFIFSNKTPGIYVYSTTQYPYRDFTYKKTSSDAVQTISNVYAIMMIYTKNVNDVPSGSVATLGYLLYAGNKDADTRGNVCTAEFRLDANGTIAVIKTTYDNSDLRFFTPGEQRITQGKKRFDIFPEISYAQTPTTDLQLVHKKYVDDAIAASDTPTITIDADVLNNMITSTDVNKVLDSIESNKSFKLLVHSNFMDFTSPAEIKSTGADSSKTYYIETIMNGMIVSTDTLVRDQDCAIYKNELEFTSHKVTSLSNASTDAEYPSAKAVYDTIKSIPGITMVSTGYSTPLIIDDLKVGVYGFSIFGTCYYKASETSTSIKSITYDTYGSVKVSPILLSVDHVHSGPNDALTTGIIIGYLANRIPTNDKEVGEIGTFAFTITGSGDNREFWLRSMTYSSQNASFLTSGAQVLRGSKSFYDLPKLSRDLTPTDNLHLTNKKYVDNQITTAKGYVDTEFDNRFFDGTETDWDALSATQREAYLFAAVQDISFDYLTSEDISNIQDTLGTDEPIVVDILEEDAINLTNDIIGGNNE